ncbi:MAG: 1-(5-phosphoribosyl)-5-[(5-phosphoribosylamino)methylideneamino]imidazole-4-carboxamide isomerase [Acutalibacteraceae bacterium]|nr:1-(5-phosphoribosyl)-5-[(5-phosphoribosylamino)methylideneamino]imidazole-4-carboxamide isomerase [Acutalibacteraceae bacterium]
MQIFPATDILGGKVVRLTKGDYNQVKIYADSPAEMALEFMKDGATNLHMVDLDGAKDGTPVNFDAIKEAARINGLFIEVGGGIRNMQRIEDYLSLGVKRVILGTAAIRNYPFVEEAVKEFGNAVAVGVDAKEGFVAVSGWQETTNVNSVEFCKKLRDTGVSTVIYTDISKDGMLSGTNLEIYKELSEIQGLDIVASGGITFADELKTLNEMGIYGAIVGKAVYEGKLSLKDALAAGGAL